MSELTIVITFLGGLGVGSILTSFVQYILLRKTQRRENTFKERNKVFKGLLQALENLETKDSVENAKRFGFWAARAQIVSSDITYQTIEAFRNSEPNSEERQQTMKLMLRAMRQDLDIQ